MLKTPETQQVWTRKVKETTNVKNPNILWLLTSDRPIVTWFCKRFPSILHLIRASRPFAEEDLWIVCGYSQGQQINLMNEPAPLRVCLLEAEKDCDLVLCEFESEMDFHSKALEYLGSEE